MYPSWYTHHGTPYPPRYTHHAQPATVQATGYLRTGLTALRQGVTERCISDDGFTDSDAGVTDSDAGIPPLSTMRVSHHCQRCGIPPMVPMRVSLPWYRCGYPTVGQRCGYPTVGQRCGYPSGVTLMQVSLRCDTDAGIPLLSPCEYPTVVTMRVSHTVEH